MTDLAARSSDTPRPLPGLAEIFFGFASVSIVAFGGVLPWARRMIVEQRRWMSAEEFNEAFALCQFLPGPNIVNFSVVFGSRCRGALGALAGLLGIMGPPVVIALVLAVLYAKFGEVPVLHRVFVGLIAATAGLVIATSLKMAEPVVRRAGIPSVVVALVVFSAVGVVRLPLLWVLILAVPFSVVLTAWWRR
jgi:chromate transporter